MKMFCKKCNAETERGKRNRCKPCHRAWQAKYDAEHSEAVQAYREKYNAENRERQNERARQRHAANPEKGRERGKKHYEENPEQYREARWKRYGIRNAAGEYFKVPDFVAMLERQRGLCALCGELLESSEDAKKAPAVDHDHDTGIARGILHQSCNTGIGLLRDCPRILARAAQYLASKTPAEAFTWIC